jgi:peptidoglycan/LPS O-acetylase OafA/YrhL
VCQLTTKACSFRADRPAGDRLAARGRSGEDSRRPRHAKRARIARQWGEGVTQAQVGHAAIPAPRRREHLRYRAHLDGLRTIAVYLVVAFHAGIFGFRGGFIGVDIFFVLSGFLVTSILLRDLTAAGRVDMRRFYSRRVRRILPAACLTLLVTAGVYAVIATPAEMLDATGGFRAAFVYVANWHFIQQATDYFAADVNGNPVLHFWSLAVEEQFYLLWPLLISMLFLATVKAGRWRWWLLRALVAALAFGSIFEAFHVATHNLERAYFGTDTRAYQLLVGALIALTPQLAKLRDRLRAGIQATVPIALAGLVFLGTSALDVSPITRGALVTFLTAVLIVGLENSRGGVTKAVLGAPPLTYLGRISYGTYLWHWPVIVVISREYTIGHWYLFVTTCVVATALSGISFHLMEHPLRASRRLDAYRLPTIATGLAISRGAGIVLIPAILDPGSGVVSRGAVPGGFKSNLRLLDWRAARRDLPSVPDCLGKPVDQCVVVHGRGKTLLLMGDSHARMWVPAFTQIARKEGLTLAVAIDSSCPWQRDLQYRSAVKFADSCRHHQADWYTRVVPQLDPDILVLVNHPYDDPARPQAMVGPDGRPTFPGDATFEETLADATTTSLRALRKGGRTIVLVEPVPVSMKDFDPVSCLSQDRPPNECAFRATTEPIGMERLYRSIGLRKDTITLNLDRLVCPRLPVCDAVIGNIIVRRDGTHLTATFARALAPQLETLLHAQHVLGRS